MMQPTTGGILAEPGRAARANKAGRKAVMAMPTFYATAMPERRLRLGNNSAWKLGNTALWP